MEYKNKTHTHTPQSIQKKAGKEEKWSRKYRTEWKIIFRYRKHRERNPKRHTSTYIISKMTKKKKC